MSVRRWWVVCLAVGAAASGVLWSRAAEPDPAAATRLAPGYVPDGDIGVSCGACHREPLPDARARGSDKFVLLREYAYWHEQDLHRRAFDALGTPLGKRMSVAMYGNEAVAAKTAACLVCHATDTAPNTPLSAKTPAQFSCELGVNCQGCHGPAAKWVGEHFRLEWRTRTAASKDTDFGLTNLRDPAVRAAKCASCHIGSAAEGKCVTHEMYAAGHPPLPAFELATFSRDEPRHWRAPGEVPAIASLDPDKALERFGYRPGEVESARLVAAGAIVSMRESVRLVKFGADAARPGEPLDFTHFNCAACHHELRLPSNRQKAGYSGVPGRPTPRTWPVWLVRIVLEHAGKTRPEAAKVSADFERHFAAFRAGFDARPFGDRAKVLVAADALAASCDEVAALIDGVDYTEPAARELLAAIASRAADSPATGRDFLDADGAYQLAQAFASISTELAGAAYDRSVPPAGPPAFDGLLKKLDAVVPLAVRRKYDNGMASGGDVALIHAGLGGRMKAYHGYDPEEFRRVFGEIKGRLSDRRRAGR